MPLIGLSLAILEENDGRTYLRSGIMDRIKAINLPRWAELYLDPKKLAVVSLLGIYTPEQLEEITRTLTASSEEDRAKFWESLVDYLSTETWMDQAVDEYLDGMNPEQMAEEFKEIFAAGDDQFRKEMSLKLQATYTGFTTSFYNSLSMMAYGAPIGEWVVRAKKGDLQSYYKAYHVDQTVADIPCFAELHERKKQELKGDFFNALSLRRRTPLIPPKLKYPKMWFAFAYLDSMGLLPSRTGEGFSLEKLLDLFVDLKIYGTNYDKGVDDLNKRLQDYRRLQKKLISRKFTS